MLGYLRNAAERPLAKVLMGILIFSFVGWGVASWIFGETSVDDTIVSIGGAPVKTGEFELERNLQLSALPRAQQKQIYSDRAAMSDFYRQILSNLSSQLMLERRASDLGFDTTTGAVADEIHRTPMFQEGGRFSLEKFDALLSANGMTEDYYAAAVRRRILRGMALLGVAAPVSAPDFAARAIYNSRHAAREIKYAAVKYGDFKVSDAPSDADLAAIYARNPVMVPEFRTISYVLVPVKNMSEPDLYDAGYARAQKLEDAIIAGEAMDIAAKKNGARHAAIASVSADKKDANGAAVSDDILTDAVVRHIFAMDPGMESEITETKSGFAIFRVEKIEPEHAAPMESVREDLARRWRDEERKKQAYLKANEILTELNAGRSPRMSAASVTRADGAPADVLVAAFANGPGAKTIVQGADAFYVLSVDSEKMPAPDNAKLGALRHEAGNMLSRALLDDYTAFLSKKYPVKVNARVYERLFGIR